ncbi:hypothetical protein AAG906_032884 [Vitis piasezkii]
MRIGYLRLTMETDCCRFVQRCPVSQIHGDLIHVPPLELHALTSPWPFSVWGIDIIGKISKSSSGHEFILVAIDYFTKWHHRSFAYKPQTNGSVEAVNKNIKRILRRMVETSQDWPEKLYFALAAWLMDLDANQFSTTIFSRFERLEPPSLLVWCSSHHFFSVSVFRATIFSQFGRSEPHLQFGFQNHHLFSYHHLFSVRAFRATISSQFGVKSHHLLVARRSKPPSLLNLVYQFSILTFRATISLQLGVQGHHRFSVMTFRVVILSLTFRESCFQFDIQSHVSSLVFRVTILSSLTFRAIILSWSGIHSHLFGVQSYVPSVQSCQPLSSILGVQSHVFSLAFRATIFFSLAFRAVSSL